MAPVRRKRARLWLASALAAIAAPALAQVIVLDGDLGADSDHRRCRYSDGEIYLAGLDAPCPPELTLEPDMGYLVHTYVEGIARYCLYRSADADRPIRVASNEPCPPSYRFTPLR